jgi:hypothetical protein
VAKIPFADIRGNKNLWLRHKNVNLVDKKYTDETDPNHLPGGYEHMRPWAKQVQRTGHVTV